MIAFIFQCIGAFVACGWAACVLLLAFFTFQGYRHETRKEAMTVSQRLWHWLVHGVLHAFAHIPASTKQRMRTTIEQVIIAIIQSKHASDVPSSAASPTQTTIRATGRLRPPQ